MFRIIIGLGNPGKEYEKTYHNAGFLALEHLARKTVGKPAFAKASTGKWEYLKTGETVLVRPLTFMNRSGEAVKGALAYFKVPPEKLLVIHDDSDLPLGKCKLVLSRGSAGHKGVESVQKALKTKNFWRLRLGIRPTGARRAKAGDFVLAKISATGLKMLYSALDGTKLKVTEN